jgi:very-short-patch-repair endonuclease
MMKPLARALRIQQTDAERLLWKHLRSRQLIGFKFRRQQIIAPYIVDLVCFETRLIVELDGGQHTEQQTEDTVRTIFLESQGFRVVRFWNNEVFENIEGVLDSIRAILTLPSPCPLPQGERGGLVVCGGVMGATTSDDLAAKPPLLQRKRELARYANAVVATKSDDLAAKLPLLQRKRELARHANAVVATKSDDLAMKLPLPLRERVG